MHSCPKCQSTRVHSRSLNKAESQQKSPLLQSLSNSIVLHTCGNLSCLYFSYECDHSCIKGRNRKSKLQFSNKHSLLNHLWSFHNSASKEIHPTDSHTSPRIMPHNVADDLEPTDDASSSLQNSLPGEGAPLHDPQLSDQVEAGPTHSGRCTLLPGQPPWMLGIEERDYPLVLGEGLLGWRTPHHGSIHRPSCALFSNFVSVEMDKWEI